MVPPNVALISCGAFNPLTHTHLRMFELARDHLNKTGEYNVICGIVSPVHDAFVTSNLVSAAHRCSMVQLALETNDWVRMSSWECMQESWTKTTVTLQHHQKCLNIAVKEHITNSRRKKRVKLSKIVRDSNWIPEDLENLTEGNVKIKLLCGADMLESLATPGMWQDEDVADIVGDHGLVVIAVEGSNPYKFIYKSEILTKYQNNITIVTGMIGNDSSSIKIRRSLRLGESVKYLIPDPVIDYIKQQGLYTSHE